MEAHKNKGKAIRRRGRKPVKFFLDAKFWCQKHAQAYLRVSKRTFQRFEDMGYITRDWNKVGAWYEAEQIKEFAKSEVMAVTRKYQKACDYDYHSPITEPE